MSEEREAALTALEAAIARCAELHTSEGEIVTDAVLVFGVQEIDDNGDRNGHVSVFPRHGSQPPYITVGLLTEGLRLIGHEQNRWTDANSDDDD
jgi:hypothetical protein